MGIMDFVEEAAGAFAAEQALEAVNPDAGILAKGATAIAGFEGASKLKEVLGARGNDTADTDETATADEDQGDDSP